MVLDLENLSTKMKEFIESKKEEWRVPGLSLSIFNDKDIRSSVIGVSLLENDKGEIEEKKLDVNSEFQIASCGKSILCAALDSLNTNWEQTFGKSIWETTIEEIKGRYGIFENINIDKSYNDIIIQHFANHRSGLKDDENWRLQNELLCISVNGGENGDIKSRAELTKRILEDPKYLVYKDKGFHYSNWGYSIMGYIIEKITGENYFEIIKKNIFTPLTISKVNKSCKNDTNCVRGHRPFIIFPPVTNEITTKYFCKKGNTSIESVPYTEYMIRPWEESAGDFF